MGPTEDRGSVQVAGCIHCQRRKHASHTQGIQLGVDPASAVMAEFEDDAAAVGTALGSVAEEMAGSVEKHLDRPLAIVPSREAVQGVERIAARRWTELKHDAVLQGAAQIGGAKNVSALVDHGTVV